MTPAELRAERARAAAAVKAARQAQAGLSRTVKLRIYPDREQAEKILRTIGAIRHVWNTLWLPMLKAAEDARLDYAKAHGETKEEWREAWKLFPDPTETQINRAYMTARDDDAERQWLRTVIGTPVTRAARQFVDALKASRGRTRGGQVRAARAGRIQPKARRNDPYAGIEWQVQGNGRNAAPLGGKHLRSVVDTAQRTVSIPSVGAVRYRDKGKQLRSYLSAGAEVCEMTVKRDGGHFYVCLSVRGLQPAIAHVQGGSSIGIDMGVVNPLATSDGELVTHHQRHDIARHQLRLEQRKLRAKRAYARKLRAAARRSGALTETGAFKKGVRIETSNRMRRTIGRINKIDRQIVGYRADWQRNVALAVARQNETIVVEALTIRNMTRSAAGTAEAPGRNVRAKSGLNRSILARGWGSMRSRLKSKAEELGGIVIEVDPANTSRACPRCGHTDKSNRLTQARFACVECGYSEHADVVGAINVLRRGLSAGASPVAGRGGFATSSDPSGADAERAGDPSNKSVREPEVSSSGTEGSRSAKPHNAFRELRQDGAMPREDHDPPDDADPTGSRN